MGSNLNIIYKPTPKTPFVLKMSEKFKIEEAGKIFHRRSHCYLEERLFPMTKILGFAVICNRMGFQSGLIHTISDKSFLRFFIFIDYDKDFTPPQVALRC